MAISTALSDGTVPAAPDDRPSLARFIWSPWTLLVVVAGLVVRLWIIHTTRGTLIADEAYTGLQSAAVLDGRFPVVIDGLAYTAPFDSYVLAPLTALVGQDVLLLKLFPSLAWAVAAVCVVGATRVLATDRTAALAGSAIWLAPGSLAVVATRAYQSYASGLATVAATIFATVVLLDRSTDRPQPWRSALVGGLAGFGFYLHPMYLAVLLPLAAVPCWHYRTRWREWWLPAVAAAVVVNGPFLIWNAKNDWPSLSQPAEATDGPFDRLLRFFTGLVPRAYGVRGQEGDWIFGAALSVLLVAALIGLAGFGAVRLLRRDRTTGAAVVVPLVVSWLLMALFTNTAFVLDGRYAIINFAFVAIVLAVGADELLPNRAWAAPAVLVAWVAVFSVPLLVNDTGTALRDPNADVRDLAALLEERGIERVSGTYWWVRPIELVSDQRIRSSVAGHPYVVLLPTTQRLVEGSPADEVAFVFWPQGDAVPLLRLPVERYERLEVHGAIVYLPRPA